MSGGLRRLGMRQWAIPFLLGLTPVVLTWIWLMVTPPNWEAAGTFQASPSLPDSARITQELAILANSTPFLLRLRGVDGPETPSEHKLFVTTARARVLNAINVLEIRVRGYSKAEANRNLGLIAEGLRLELTRIQQDLLSEAETQLNSLRQRQKLVTQEIHELIDVSRKSRAETELFGVVVALLDDLREIRQRVANLEERLIVLRRPVSRFLARAFAEESAVFPKWAISLGLAVLVGATAAAVAVLLRAARTPAREVDASEKSTVLDASSSRDAPASRSTDPGPASIASR